MLSRFEQDLLDRTSALRSYALHLTRQGAAAEDLVQDTMLCALAARDSYAEGTNLSAWLNAIMKNQFISAMRKRRPLVDIDLVSEAELADKSRQYHSLLLSEVLESLPRILPSSHRAVLLRAEGESYDQLAELLGYTVGYSKIKVLRSRRILAAFIEGASETSLRIGKSRSKEKKEVSVISAPHSRRRRSRPSTLEDRELRKRNKLSERFYSSVFLNDYVPEIRDMLKSTPIQTLREFSDQLFSIYEGTATRETMFNYAMAFIAGDMLKEPLSPKLPLAIPHTVVLLLKAHEPEARLDPFTLFARVLNHLGPDARGRWTAAFDEHLHSLFATPYRRPGFRATSEANADGPKLKTALDHRANGTVAKTAQNGPG